MEDDDFWNVALEKYSDSSLSPFDRYSFRDDDNGHSENDEQIEDDVTTMRREGKRRGNFSRYTLPLPIYNTPQLDDSVSAKTARNEKKDHLVTNNSNNHEDSVGNNQCSFSSSSLQKSSFTLKLASLAESCGIWSPLGSKAWHASALLAAYLLRLPPEKSTSTSGTATLSASETSSLPEQDKDIIHSKSDDSEDDDYCSNHQQLHWCHYLQLNSSSHTTSIESNNNDSNKKDNIITVLELGSGAVGLSGISLGVALSRYFSSMIDDDHRIDKIKVILTDLNDDGIVDNLRQNVHNNEECIRKACCNEFRSNSTRSIIPDIQVETLDWNDFNKTIRTDDDCSQKQHQHVVPSTSQVPPTWFTRDLDWVVGSELVYTEETGLACASVVSTLLQRHPNLVVFILQVLDRDGFLTHFIPTLEHQNFEVTIQQPLDANLHRIACDIVQSNSTGSSANNNCLGGTLDRFDYGGCWIRNKTK